MRTRTLGTDLTVSAVGLGCMGMSDFYGPHDDEVSTAVLDHALDLGVTLFDTSDMYGVGHNEELLGRWLARTRDQVVLATKFGISRDPADPSKRRIRGDAAYVREACDASLRRLGTDRIDLYYAHRIDPTVPIGDRRRARRARRGRKGAPHRPVRGGARDDPPRARRAPADRTAERVVALVARP